jgi:class 3 adenylate cyclase
MTDFALPGTRYAQSGDINIAYQVMGNGPIDVIMVPGMVSHVEFAHEIPGVTAFLRRLSSFARFVMFDKRGQGLSDRMSGAPSLEQRMDDVGAVMDAIGSQRAVLLGFSEGCAISALFAATYPKRVSHLILYGGFACSADRMTQSAWQARLDRLVTGWGTGILLRELIPSLAANPVSLTQFGKLERLSSSPGALRTLLTLNHQINVKPILPTLRVPTLVLHRQTDAQVQVALGRAMAAGIPGSKYIEYPTGDHAFWTGDTEALLGDIEEFVTGHRDRSFNDLERVLATVLFTDIVGSTQSAAEMGDQRWRRLLDSHDDLARQIVEKHRGSLVKSTGDGILAMFDGPSRAVHCALAFMAGAQQIGLHMRAGIHTGEVELRAKDTESIAGIAVHAASRVMAHSGSDEVLVSRVVTDLVAGAGLRFTERGCYELKGLPGHWDLFVASI